MTVKSRSRFKLAAAEQLVAADSDHSQAVRPTGCPPLVPVGSDPGGRAEMEPVEMEASEPSLIGGAFDTFISVSIE